jgi:hypothetical protein
MLEILFTVLCKQREITLLYSSLSTSIAISFHIVVNRSADSNRDSSLEVPAIRVTIASNAKQSQKAPVVIPASASADPAAASSIRALVFKTAQSKLRLKKPIRVYVGRTGQELLTEDD